MSLTVLAAESSEDEVPSATVEVKQSSESGGAAVMMTRPGAHEVEPVQRSLAEFNGGVEPSTSLERRTALVRAILAGPTEAEKASGLGTALSVQSRLVSVSELKSDFVEIRFEVPPAPNGAPKLTPHAVEHFADQVHNTLNAEGVRSIRFLVKDGRTGKFVPPLSLFRQQPDDPAVLEQLRRQDEDALPTKEVERVESTLSKSSPQPNFVPGPNNGGFLSNVAVVLNPGHGWLDDTNGWRVQRGKLYENLEDFGTAETFNNFLIPALLNAGARVQPVRECDPQTNMVIVDNAAGSPNYVETGTWANSSANGFVNKTGASWAGLTNNPFGNASATRFVQGVNGAPTATATYTLNVPATGYYNVYISYSASTNRTAQAHWQVKHSGGTTDYRVNQKRDGGTWNLLGNFYFVAGSDVSQRQIVVLNDTPDAAIVTCDAVRIGGGMGDVARRTHGVSGKMRWQEEACNYLQYNGMLASSLLSGDDTVTYDDEQLGWGNRPQYANWEQARDSEGTATIYIGWHTNALNGTCTGGAEQSGTARGTASYRDVDADAIAGTENLAAAVHNSFINGMRKLYNTPSWQDRGVIGSNGYGEGSQGNLGGVAGFFFEGLFHDNSSDMNVYRDPKFRQITARAIVQGVISYYGGTVFPPETPDRVRAQRLPNGKVRVSWVAGPVRTANLPYGSAATGYRVYRSANGYGFDNGVDAGNNLSLDLDVTTGTTTYLQVRAYNSAGISFPTETIGARTPTGGETPVLLVYGYHRFDRFLPPRKAEVSNCIDSNVRRLQPKLFNSMDYIVQHGDALAANGVAFDSCSDSAVEAGAINLNAYRTVVWIAGQEAEADTGDSTVDTAVKANCQTQLTNFLAAGRNLLFSGSETAWDFDRPTGPTAAQRAWISGTLKANYSADGAGTYQATGATGGIFAGIPTLTFDNGTGTTYDVRFPDVLTPASGATACLNYSGGSGGAAAVQYEGPIGASVSTSRVVYMGFGFETITTSVNRNTVMARVMDFFRETPRAVWNTFPTSAGWAAFTGELAPLQFLDYDATNGALRGNVGADAQGRYRLAGWWANSTGDQLPISSVLAGQWVRAKFAVYAGNNANVTKLPNMRLRVANRFAVNSMLEVFHNQAADPDGSTFAQDFRPTTNSATPSVYSVDAAPILVPYLTTNSATEGFNRAFEAYAEDPDRSGFIALTETTIGTYVPAARDTTTRIKTYTPAANDFQTSVANSLKFIVAPDLSSVTLDSNPPFATVSTGPGLGVTFDSTGIASDRVAIATLDLIAGAAEDVDRTKRARVEEGYVYAVKFHVIGSTPATNMAQVRLRTRTVKFMWAHKLELGGAWAIGNNASTGNAAIATQVLPGTGSLNPDKRTVNEAGGWYTAVFPSPLNREIRSDFGLTTPLTTSMPNISAQDPPGVTTGKNRRDILLGMDVIDTLSFGPNAGLEQANVTLDGIEIYRLPRNKD